MSRLNCFHFSLEIRESVNSIERKIVFPSALDGMMKTKQRTPARGEAATLAVFWNSQYNTINGVLDTTGGSGWGTVEEKEWAKEHNETLHEKKDIGLETWRYQLDILGLVD